jgi:hypothetical protein
VNIKQEAENNLTKIADHHTLSENVFVKYSLIAIQMQEKSANAFSIRSFCCFQ